MANEQEREKLAYHDAPATATGKLGQAIYHSVLGDRRGFRPDQIGIPYDDDEIWCEIFDDIGRVALTAGPRLPDPGSPEEAEAVERMAQAISCDLQMEDVGALLREAISAIEAKSKALAECRLAISGELNLADAMQVKLLEARESERAAGKRALAAEQEIARLRAALAERDEWLPVETAPHGEDVLLYCPAYGFASPACVEVGPYSSGWRRDGYSTMSYHARATHWRPLPPPPTLSPAPQEGDKAEVYCTDCDGYTVATRGPDGFRCSCGSGRVMAR